MKRLVFKILLLIVAVLALLAVILIYEFNAKDCNTPTSYLMNVRRCAERLDTLSGPKIIFIGGSGCCFGIKSEMISEHFNMPVVNTGTHASIGLRLQMEIFKKYISVGDIIVVIPEYSNYSKGHYLGNNEPPLQILNIYPEAWNSCPFWQRLKLCRFIPKYYKIKTYSIADDSPYSINALNEYGDITSYDKRSKSQEIEVYGKSSGYNPCVKEYIKGYKQYVEKRGAYFILLPPALAKSSFENNQDFIDYMYSKYNEDGEKLFSDRPEACSLPDSLYFDTPYHLTTQGIEVRSQILIQQIESALGVRVTMRAER